MATTYIYRDATSDVAVQKATISFWVKKCGQGTSQYIFFCGLTGDYSSYSFYMKFHTDDTIKIVGASPGTTISYQTDAKFRDPTAWMHIVIKLDMTETGNDRCIMYINGVEETNYSTQTAMTGSEWYTGKTGYRQFIGYAPSEDTYSSVVLSHYQYIDGLALAPTEFGEVDSTSGIWKIKTSCYGTPGTNGFCLKMEDRTNLDLDSSDNALTMTTSGDLTATYDNPSNNFPTMNILDNYFQGATFSKGNLYTVMSTSNYAWITGTMPLFAGLWYYETYVDVSVDTDDYLLIGASPYTAAVADKELGTNAAWSQDLGYYGYTGGYRRANASNSYGDTFGDGNYIGTYIDLDAEKIYWSKDGVIQNSGTGVALTAIADTPFGYWLPAMSQYGSGATYSINFGNGYFGTTLITSPSADEGGIGAFKYNPSTGTFDGSSKDFRAICTKNIKLYGAP